MKLDHLFQNQNLDTTFTTKILKNAGVHMLKQGFVVSKMEKIAFMVSLNRRRIVWKVITTPFCVSVQLHAKALQLYLSEHLYKTHLESPVTDLAAGSSSAVR